jgi:immune inhibitor A
MQGPPWRRIQTDGSRAVNCGGPAIVAAVLLVAVVGVDVCRAAATVGDLHLLVILAGFPDRPMAKQREHFVGRRTALVDRLVAYYAEVSSGRLRIVPAVGEAVVTLPRRRATYVQRPDAIARDALVAFAAAATSDADRAALARAESFLVFFAGAGRESHTASGDPGDPWSNQTTLVPGVTVPGARRFDEAIVIAEKEIRPFSSFGVLCHEFGHLLGLPELYAPGGLPQEGIGVWGLMGQGTWLRRGERPPQLCAWSKARLGWVDVETIAESTAGVDLAAVEQVPRVVKIAAAPDNPKEYYLLENRARIGADRSLPGVGLLVWHVDERVGGYRTGQVNAAHKLLHLVEADGRGDLDRGHAAGGNRGDPTDPWTGPPAWRRRVAGFLALAGALLVAAAVFRMVRPRPFVPVMVLGVAAAAAIGGATRLARGPVCGPGTPGMAPYDGGPARVTIRSISPAGPVMRFDVLVAPPRGAD